MTRKFEEYWEINEDLGIPSEAGVELVGALSNDYYCVYYVDFDLDLIQPYRVAKAILADYKELLGKETNYTKVLTTYANTTVIEEDREAFLKEIKKETLMKRLAEKQTYFYDFRAIIKGQVMFCRMKVVDVSPSEDEHVAVMGFSDVSREVSKEIEGYAFIDEITGGDNYHRFKENMEDVDRDGFIISIDIRSFKVINAACGIAQGDEVIKRIWRKLLGGLRPGEYAAHVNGDRFVAYMPLEEEDQVVYNMKRLQDELLTISDEINCPKIEAYFGVAEWHVGDKVEDAVTKANEAQHRIRDSKDEFYSFYTQADFDRLMEENAMEQSFRTAIKDQQFEVWYQPKYATEGDKVVGAEALVRWRKPDGSLWPPYKFISLFERNGQIRDLDEYVFTQVCKDQRAWMDEGIDLIPISVNLSRASLYFTGVAERYIEIAKELGIDAKWVPIEITETAAANNDNINEIINVFSNAGFFLHMDDFGTGYSSLSMLNQYNFDTLKLDKSLIDYIGNYSGDRLLLHTISLAKDLGMQVVAEGVEDDTQIGFLRKTECDSIQGYVYSKPLEREAFYNVLTTTDHGVAVGKRDIDLVGNRYKSDLGAIISQGAGMVEAAAAKYGVDCNIDVDIPQPMVYVNKDLFATGIYGMQEVVFKNAGPEARIDVQVSEYCDVARGSAILEVIWNCQDMNFEPAMIQAGLTSNQQLKELREYLDKVGAIIDITFREKTLYTKMELSLKLVMTE